MFARLAAAGAQIVVNDVLPLDREGLFPGRAHRLAPDELGRADHRKLYVLDGAVAGRAGPASRTTSRTAASMT